MRYIIENDREGSYNFRLFWSNTDGWVSIESATIFSYGAPSVYNLPIDGKWVELSWFDCD